MTSTLTPRPTRMSPGPFSRVYNDQRNWVDVIASDGFTVATFDVEEHGEVEEANAVAVENIPTMMNALRDIRRLVNGFKGMTGRELVIRAEINRIVDSTIHTVEDWRRPEAEVIPFPSQEPHSETEVA